MAFWLIGGSAVLAAWAVLSVMGNELTRRTRELKIRLAVEPRAEPTDSPILLK